jgi:hypothetical protein
VQDTPDSERAARYGSRDEPGHCSLGVLIGRVAGHRRASTLAKRSQSLLLRQLPANSARRQSLAAALVSFLFLSKGEQGGNLGVQAGPGQAKRAMTADGEAVAARQGEQRETAGNREPEQRVRD